MIKELKLFDIATDVLTKCFVKKYFGEEYIDDWYFVGTQDEDREILAINDYFFNLSDIVSFLRYNYSVKELFKYYDYALENETCENIRSWKKLNGIQKNKKISPVV